MGVRSAPMKVKNSLVRLGSGGKRVAADHALRRVRGATERSRATTLSIDIGGTGIKMILLDADGRPLTERVRMLTPKPARPQAVLDVIRRMIGGMPRFDRVSVGFPGVVDHGIVRTAVNLGGDIWRDHPLEHDLERLCRCPVRVINDADLQGYGVVEGRGVELVLTLGTGLGSALFVDGRLVPNLELGHHPFKKGKTYEERVSDAELKRLGKKEWSKRVLDALETLLPIFNPRILHLGGGNAQLLKGKVPSVVRTFGNVDGMTGGIKLWSDVLSARARARRTEEDQRAERRSVGSVNSSRAGPAAWRSRRGTPARARASARAPKPAPRRACARTRTRARRALPSALPRGRPCCARVGARA